MTYRTPWINRFLAAVRQPRFFSRYEWRYHLLMMPLLFPLGNYYLIGPRYFTEPLVFFRGTALVFGLYWLSIYILTVTVRLIIRRYPTPRQTRLRMFVMLLAVSGLVAILACFDVWVYSLVPQTGVRFGWAAIRPVLLLGLVFGVILCMVLGLVYMYSQWHKNLREDEELQREMMQRQYDSLKGQLNPHFLFNALNSLSVLIGEDTRQAEEFVDKLAVVYRYMLQPGRRAATGEGPGLGELVSLQEELDFIDAYADLLEIRYGNSFQVIRPDVRKTALAAYRLPPLSLQTLLDNAIKHNGMSAGSPLRVQIEIIADGWVQVTNNRQQKVIRMEISNPGLSGLIATYQRLSEKAITVEATESQYRVRLPLLFRDVG